jgi:hypothetical protein
MCIHKECKISPIYNKKGETKALYCFAHKLEGMINVKSPICIHEGCNIRPVYNKKGETKALYCFAHKLEGMINVKSQICIHEGCKIQSTYNKDGETKALYCSEHKLEEMIDIKSKRCIHKECKISPTFNKKGETKALYCSAHKLEGMINVKSHTCIHEGCKIIPVFNNDGETKALYCSKHKLEGMIDIKSNKCIHEECKIIPFFNNEGETKALYCSKHKLEGMIDIKHNYCKSYLCFTHGNKKYDGFCLYCYMHLFPDKPVLRNYKTKEYAVIEFVKTTFPDLSWISDKRISGGCSKKRPDLFLDLGYQVIIIEVDENQHTTYDCSCENKRIMELSNDVGHKPIVFIRFNPDDYEENEIVIKSCWGVNKKGICVVKKLKEWDKRLNTLKEQINYWIHPDNITTKTVETIQLFYDL